MNTPLEKPSEIPYICTVNGCKREGTHKVTYKIRESWLGGIVCENCLETLNNLYYKGIAWDATHQEGKEE